MGSSCVIRWVYSICAEGNCDSDVPFCDRCSTQLCIGLSYSLFLVPFAYILLVGYILHGMVAGFISSLPATHPLVCPADVSLAFGSVSICLVIHPLGREVIAPLRCAFSHAFMWM